MNSWLSSEYAWPSPISPWVTALVQNWKSRPIWLNNQRHNSFFVPRQRVSSFIPHLKPKSKYFSLPLARPSPPPSHPCNFSQCRLFPPHPHGRGGQTHFHLSPLCHPQFSSSPHPHVGGGQCPQPDMGRLSEGFHAYCGRWCILTVLALSSFDKHTLSMWSVAKLSLDLSLCNPMCFLTPSLRNNLQQCVGSAVKGACGLHCVKVLV